MATKKEWVIQLLDAGAELFPETGTADFLETKESISAKFETSKFSKDDWKESRDDFARELRKDGWTVYTEPESRTNGSDGERFSYALNANRPRNYNDGVVDAPGYGKNAKNLFSQHAGVIARDAKGELPHYAWPGGYTILYVTEDGGTLCPKCANLPQYYCNEDLHSKPKIPDKMNHIVAGDVYYEGPTLQCDDCNADIESSYGDPEEDGSAGRQIAGRKTEQEWIDAIRAMPLGGCWPHDPRSPKENEYLAGWFGAPMNDTASQRDAEQSRNRLVKELRAEGWQTWTEPKSHMGGTDEFVWPFSAMRKGTGQADVGRRVKINYPISYTANSMGHYLVKDETTADILPRLKRVGF